MRINLRGGGDIASNPGRLRCRAMTDQVNMLWRERLEHGAQTPINAPGSTIPPLPVPSAAEAGAGDSMALTGPEAVAFLERAFGFVPHPPKDGTES